MIQVTDRLNGAVIKSVELTDEVEGQKYAPYRLTIETDKGTLVFEGCHDMVGDLIVDGIDVGKIT